MDTTSVKRPPLPANGAASEKLSTSCTPALDFCTSWKWSWSCRALDRLSPLHRIQKTRQLPRPGDVAVVQVESVGKHVRIMTADHSPIRLYPGDRFAAVFGNRYATDAFEGRVETVEDLQLLTAGGMIGTVLSSHQSMASPTKLSFGGYLLDEDGERVNLKGRLFTRNAPRLPLDNIILVVGTGMNAGKTTTACKLVRGLLQEGFRTAACKVTGSVSHRDPDKFRSTGAHYVRDFSDYGFPSTYLCSRDEIIELFYLMMSDAARSDPEVTVVEVADGVLQRETRMLLEDPVLRAHVSGVVLSAGCALSALRGIEEIEKRGHNVVCVSGCITSSPLFVRELEESTDVPAVSSVGTGDELATRVTENLKTRA